MCIDPNFQLHASFGAKRVDLSWPRYDDATSYQLLFSNDGETFAPLGEALPATASMTQVPLSVHLIAWPRARYRLLACSGDDCVQSADLAIGDAMLSAIGYVKASNTDSEDHFGFAIAISGDGTTLAVGAREEDASAEANQSTNDTESSGAVYVFRRSDNVWKQEYYLKAFNADAGDHFGSAVALSDDGNTLAVGAPQEDGGSPGVNGTATDNSVGDAGAAYVFTRAGNSWYWEAYIKPPNPGTEDYFGDAIALSGDGNTLAIGAKLEDSSSPGVGGNPNDETTVGAGAVYMFSRSIQTWEYDAYLKASLPHEGASFGGALALSTDGNTLAVGAAGERSGATGINNEEDDTSKPQAGAVYVFLRTANSWWQHSYIKASTTDFNDNFGWSVALSGDGDTLAVGAIGESSKATGIDGDQADDSIEGAGAVFTFTRNVDGVWSQQSYLKPSYCGELYSFGWRVALSGDGNTLAVASRFDGSAALGVGGDATNHDAYDSGSVYAFMRSNGAWSSRAYIKSSNLEARDWFGTDLALSADGGTLAVSAVQEASAATGLGGDQHDNSAQRAGAVYLY